MDSLITNARTAILTGYLKVKSFGARGDSAADDLPKFSLFDKKTVFSSAWPAQLTEHCQQEHKRAKTAEETNGELFPAAVRRQNLIDEFQDWFLILRSVWVLLFE